MSYRKVVIIVGRSQNSKARDEGVNGVHCCRHQAAYHCPDCAGKVLVSPREFYERVLDIWEERTGVNGKPRVVTPADWKWSLEQALAELEGNANYD